MKEKSTPLDKDSILNDEMVRETTVESLKNHLPLQINGYKVTTELVCEVLLHAAVNNKTIEASTQDLAPQVSSNAVREQLHKQLKGDNISELEQSSNSMLRDRLPRRARRGRFEIAIDLHDQPFYGQDDEWVCRGEAKAGTTRFYRVATAYLICQGVRFTLGLKFVRPEHDKAELLKILLERVEQAGVKLKRLWCDKGFASISVYRFLQARSINATIACPIRGKPGGKGTRSLCRGRKSYHTQHSFYNPKYGSETVPLTVVRTWSLRKGKRRSSWLLFVQLGHALPPGKVREGYRLRFGVESSYRCMREVKGKTTSKSPALRFLFMALGFILVNMWIALRFLFCQIPKRGRRGRPLAEKRFRLSRFAFFLRRAIERRYELVTAISAIAPPIGV
jgi:putative transposase